jgi:hypothetical protein
MKISPAKKLFLTSGKQLGVLLDVHPEESYYVKHISLSQSSLLVFYSPFLAAGEAVVLHVEGQGKNGHTYYANGILVHNFGAGPRRK